MQKLGNANVIRWFLSIVFRIHIAHDFRVIGSRKWALARTQRKKFPSSQVGLEALPMMQRVIVRARFQMETKFFLMHGHLPVFTWFVLRFDSLLWPQPWMYPPFMLLGRCKVRFGCLSVMFISTFYICRESYQFLALGKMAVIPQ